MKRPCSSPPPPHGFLILFMLVVTLGIRCECAAPTTKTFEVDVSYKATSCRKHSVSLVQFGGVGDGVTSNTKAFVAAVDYLNQFKSDGGGLLYVPAGKWLTGSFNITSHFTLYLSSHAVILGSQNIEDWPIIAPLPSYGRGRDADGGRHGSLIMGYNLTDVIITGENGTIDGQGEMWWTKYRAKQLTYTRGYLIEIQNTDGILISNITLINSPSWNIHPVYSKNIIVSGVTILASVDSANTDGINPDSCSQVLIQDSYVVSGDDCIAIKSGWDQYGMKFGMPSKEISIKRFSCISPYSAVIAIGSEMSGGVKDIRAEHITALNTESVVRIKSAVGRGAYVKDIFARNVVLDTMKYVFWMTGNYGQHADDNFDPKALPVVDNISYSNIVAKNVTMAGRMEGIEGAPYKGICISNVTMDVRPSDKLIWNCTNVSGRTSNVSPVACPQFPDSGPTAAPCPFPSNRLAIEDVVFQECNLRV